MTKIKLTKKEKNVLIASSIVLFLLTFSSWILNFGYLRLIMSFILFPIFHYTAALLINIFSAMQRKFSDKLKIYTLIYNISYVLFHFLLPDEVDDGERYFFYGLIKSDAISKFASVIAWVCLAVGTVLFILQIVEIVIAKKKQKRLQSEGAGE